MVTVSRLDNGNPGWFQIHQNWPSSAAGRKTRYKRAYRRRILLPCLILLSEIASIQTQNFETETSSLRGRVLVRRAHDRKRTAQRFANGWTLHQGIIINRQLFAAPDAWFLTIAQTIRPSSVVWGFNEKVSLPPR